MTLPSSGTLKFSDIRDEFGGSDPVVFSDYYRGGGLVPDISANSDIPTSGTIKLSDFYGATNLLVTLANTYNRNARNSSGGQCAAGIKVKRDGNIATSLNDSSHTPNYINVGGDPNEWADPASVDVGDEFHVRMVTTSGSFTGAASDDIDTWLAITSDRTFEVRAFNDLQAWTGKMQISDDGGSTVREETSDFTIEADGRSA